MFNAIISETNESYIEAIEARIRQEISLHNAEISKPHLKLGISIGHIMQENPEQSIETLMKKADQKMYLDKTHKYQT